MLAVFVGFPAFRLTSVSLALGVSLPGSKLDYDWRIAKW